MGKRRDPFARKPSRIPRREVVESHLLGLRGRIRELEGQLERGTAPVDAEDLIATHRRSLDALLEELTDLEGEARPS